LDKLKIDRSFISQIRSHQPSQAITEAIIALGRSLNLKVVGEGIESEEDREYLRDHGCDQGQGYLFSRPLPAAEFESWYRNHLRLYH
jgi:EAL domain-containing protein (putative c-di-GMP-specific phosphodiesterase class I)